jgi:WD40 repeat protein
VAFSPDGTMLASGSDDQTIILWDVANKQQIGDLLQGHTAEVTNVAFSPDGQTLASGSSTSSGLQEGPAIMVVIWDVATGQEEVNIQSFHDDFFNTIVFTPDGKTIASGGNDGVAFWDVATGQLIGELAFPPSNIQEVVFNPDGQILASVSRDGTIILWNMTTGQPNGMLPTFSHFGQVHSVTFSPDGQTLVSGGNKRIILWEIATWQLITTLEGYTDDVKSVAFSPDGQTLASGGMDGAVILWNVASGQPIGEPLEGHTLSVESVVFSPDGTLLASGSLDNTIILWDVATSKQWSRLEGHKDRVNNVAFSPDGTILASASSDNTIILWDVATGNQQAHLEGHMNGVNSVAFSPDGKILASGSLDNTIILWDMATGQPIGEPLEDAPVQSIAYSPDGQTLASGGSHAIKLWGLSSWHDPQVRQQRACQIANRNLTWQEWQRYLPGEPYQQTCPNLPPHPSAVEAGLWDEGVNQE